MTPEYTPHFAGHQTFTLRHSWLPKAAALLANGPMKLIPEDVMMELGVGKNMVEAIKHWLQATKVAARDSDGVFRLTGWGRNLLHPQEGTDPYLEDEANLWILHWNMATQPHRCGSLYYLFNEFGTNEFTEDLLVETIVHWATKQELKVARDSIKRDVSVVLRSYTKPKSKHEIEDIYQCPFIALRLILEPSKGQGYYFNSHAASSIPEAALRYILEDYQGMDTSRSGTIAFDMFPYRESLIRYTQKLSWIFRYSTTYSRF
jgi:hypothetical protein